MPGEFASAVAPLLAPVLIFSSRERWRDLRLLADYHHLVYKDISLWLQVSGDAAKIVTPETSQIRRAMADAPRRYDDGGTSTVFTRADGAS